MEKEKEKEPEEVFEYLSFNLLSRIHLLTFGGR